MHLILWWFYASARIFKRKSETKCHHKNHLIAIAKLQFENVANEAIVLDWEQIVSEYAVQLWLTVLKSEQLLRQDVLPRKENSFVYYNLFE